VRLIVRDEKERLAGGFGFVNLSLVSQEQLDHLAGATRITLLCDVIGSRSLLDQVSAEQWLSDRVLEPVRLVTRRSLDPARLRQLSQEAVAL
jgi:predicted nucleotidyltransferase